MSLGFLSASATGAIARSPMERPARAAGARFELRDGWNVATEYPGALPESGWADVSHLPKWELQGTLPELELGRATRQSGAWWCPLTAARALVIGEPPAELSGCRAVDVTSVFGALVLTGPLAREIFARFCALDLRDAVTPVGSFRPGSIARQPGLLVREAPERWLFLFGSAVGEYMWTTVADAGSHLGAGPLGADALAPLEEARHEEPARA